MILIICGVSGTGKSTIGALVANALELPFFDGDDFHPERNVRKMQHGEALDDMDRQPWLETLANKIAIWEKQGGAVLACSALKKSYRRTLASKGRKKITWVFLNGSQALLSNRLASRKDHFFDSQLLESQFKALELPDHAWVIDVQSSPDEIVTHILKYLSEN